MSKPGAIVRDLATRSPVIDSDLGDYCALCRRVATAEVELMVPASHEEHCAWRRAREMFPDRPG
jgi:hypothetical protein